MAHITKTQRIARVGLIICLLIVLSQMGKPIGWSLGVIKKASVQKEDIGLLENQIEAVRMEQAQDISKAYLSPAEIAQSSPERVDEAFRDKSYVERAGAASAKIDFLQNSLQREQIRQENSKKLPIAYGLLALSLLLLISLLFFLYALFFKFDRISGILGLAPPQPDKA